MNFLRRCEIVSNTWRSRMLMGMFEGFLMPSLTLMLANWYKRDEIGLRISYLFSKMLNDRSVV